MWKFVYKINADGSKQPVAKKPNLLLPDPNKCKNPQQQREFIAANDALTSSKALISTPQKRHKFSDETRLLIAKTCIDIGPIKTVRYFKERDILLAESTVRKIKKDFLNQKLQQKADTPTFVQKKRGRKLLIGDLEEKVLTFVRALRAEVNIINCTILISLGRAIVKANPKCGISYERLTRTWALSFLKRHKYVTS